MSAETVTMFNNVFKKLPQRVLWKIELKQMPDLPSNVMTKKWVPQLNILGNYRMQIEGYRVKRE